MRMRPYNDFALALRSTQYRTTSFLILTINKQKLTLTQLKPRISMLRCVLDTTARTIFLLKKARTNLKTFEKKRVESRPSHRFAKHLSSPYFFPFGNSLYISFAVIVSPFVFPYLSQTNKKKIRESVVISKCSY